MRALGWRRRGSSDVGAAALKRERSDSMAMLAGGSFSLLPGWGAIDGLASLQNNFNYVEVLNAVTMVTPTLVAWSFSGYCDYMDGSLEIFCRSAVLASPLHLPASVAFHVYSVFNPPTAKHSLTLRRLDNSFVLISGAFFAHGLSASHAYGALALLLNLLMAASFWLPGRGLKPDIAACVACIALYTGPMLWYGCPVDFILTLAGFATTLWVWRDARKFFGCHAHPLMHVVLGLPTLMLVRFAVNNLGEMAAAAEAVESAEAAAGVGLLVVAGRAASAISRVRKVLPHLPRLGAAAAAAQELLASGAAQ